MKIITTRIAQIFLTVFLIHLFTTSVFAGSYLPWRLGYKTIKVDNKNVDI
jgi:hypothetical protein